MTRVVLILIAVATLSAGPLLQSTAPGTVWIHATVVDAAGRLVTHLERDNFGVEVDGASQPVSVFSKDVLPFSSALMLDISGSMTNNLPLVRQGAELFLAEFVRGDRVNIGTFGGDVRLTSRFTANRLKILGLIDLAGRGADTPCIPPSLTSNLPQRRGGTAMWDGIECGIHALMTDGEAIRRIVVVITDGKDNASSGTAVTTSQWAARAGVMVYAIGMLGGGGLNAQELKAIAADTGGGYFALDARTDMPEAFRRLAEELHRQYILGFVPKSSAAGRHRVNVTLNVPGLTVRARRSYDIAGVMR